MSEAADYKGERKAQLENEIDIIQSAMNLFSRDEFLCTYLKGKLYDRKEWLEALERFH